MGKVELIVISTPVTVQYVCPHCEDEIETSYSSFCTDVAEPCDWTYTKFECPECGNEIEIDSVDWD